MERQYPNNSLFDCDHKNLLNLLNLLLLFIIILFLLFIIYLIYRTRIVYVHNKILIDDLCMLIVKIMLRYIII